MKFTVLDGQIGYKIILFINAEIQKTDFIKSTHPAIKSNQIKSNQIKSNQAFRDVPHPYTKIEVTML